MLLKQGFWQNMYWKKCYINTSLYETNYVIIKSQLQILQMWVILYYTKWGWIFFNATFNLIKAHWDVHDNIGFIYLFIYYVSAWHMVVSA